MDRKSVYIETSIVSYLAARRSRNLVVAAWQEVSWEFWEAQRSGYDLYTSELVIAEASVGDAEAAERRVALLRGLRELTVSDEAKALAGAILADGALPRRAEFDALHIAVATVHSLDLILTWNCRHIDNPVSKPRVREICWESGYACPEICTPLELTEGRLQ